MLYCVLLWCTLKRGLGRNFLSVAPLKKPEAAAAGAGHQGSAASYFLPASPTPPSGQRIHFVFFVRSIVQKARAPSSLMAPVRTLGDSSCERASQTTVSVLVVNNVYWFAYRLASVGALRARRRSSARRRPSIWDFFPWCPAQARAAGGFVDTF